MAFFAVNYLYRSEADVAAVRPAHRSYLAGLIEQGPLKASGPLVGTEQDGGLLIFEADSREAVEAMVVKDPMYTEGILEAHMITEWNPVLGVFAK